MSCAGVFAAVLAKSRKVELVTGDPEFKQVKDEIRIGWLKRSGKDGSLSVFSVSGLSSVVRCLSSGWRQGNLQM